MAAGQLPRVCALGMRANKFEFTTSSSLSVCTVTNTLHSMSYGIYMYVYFQVPDSTVQTRQTCQSSLCRRRRRRRLTTKRPLLTGADLSHNGRNPFSELIARGARALGECGPCVMLGEGRSPRQQRDRRRPEGSSMVKCVASLHGVSLRTSSLSSCWRARGEPFSRKA
jgi:hypothetical protein